MSGRGEPRPKALDPIRAAASGATPAAEAPVAGIRASAGGASYSITELAEATGWHRDTISDWTRRKEHPLPVEAGGRNGVEYRINLRRLIEWREELARQEGMKGPVEGGFQFMGIKDPYKAIQARQRFISMGESEAALIHRAPMQEALQRAFGILRQTIMAIPDRLSRSMAGFPRDKVDGWRRDARGYCQEALTEAMNQIHEAALASATEAERTLAAAKASAAKAEGEAAA